MTKETMELGRQKGENYGYYDGGTRKCRFFHGKATISTPGLVRMYVFMKRITYKKSMLPLVLSILILLIGINGIQLRFLPTIVPDELGYWTAGAYLSGLDWSNIMSSSPSYGVGYGFLLAPLFLLKEPVLIYRSAIILNAIMLVGCFCLARAAGHTLFPRIPYYTTDLIAFVISIYPYNTFYTKYTMSEVIMTFVLWVLFYQLILVLRKPTVPGMIFLAVIAAYLFTIHLRALGVLVALFLTLLVAVIRKKILIQHLLSFLAVAIILIALGSLYRNQVVATEYTDHTAQTISVTGQQEETVQAIQQIQEEKVDANGVQAQTAKVLKLFTWQGIVGFVLGVFGRFFYWAAGTFLISSLGLLFLTRKIICSLRPKSRAAVSTAGLLTFENEIEIALFVLCGALFSQAISSLSMIDPARIDTIMYGRYADFFVGPVLYFGIVYIFYGGEKKKSTYGIFYLLQGIIAFLLYMNIRQTGVNTINTNSLVATWGFPAVDGMSDQIFFTFYACLCGIVGAQILLLIQRRTQRSRMIFVLVLSIFWLFAGIKSTYADATYINDSLDIVEVSSYVRQIKKDDNKIWYWYEEDSTDIAYFRMYSLQYMFNDSKMEKLNQEKISSVGENDVVIKYNSGNTPSELIEWAEGKAIYLDKYTIYCRNVETVDMAETSKSLSLKNQALANGAQIQEMMSDGSWKSVYTQGIDEQQDKQNIDSKKEICIVTNAANELVKEKWEEELLEQQTPVETEPEEAQNMEEEIVLGIPQYSVYGNQVSLHPGTYRATFTLECLNFQECEEDFLGQCDISINGGQTILASFPMTKEMFQDGGAKSLQLDFSTAADETVNAEFRVYTNTDVQFRITDISYHYVSPEVKAILPGTEDYNTVNNLISLDSDFLPVYMGAPLYAQQYLDVSDLESAVSNMGHSFRCVSFEEIANKPNGFLLIPFDRMEIIQSLLPDFTILARLQSYALLAPSASRVCMSYRDNGGYALSDGTAINLRYFEGASSSLSSIQATVPEGNYRLDYTLHITGSVLFDSFGKLVISYASQRQDIFLLKDDFEFEVCQGRIEIALEEESKVNIQLATLPEVSGAQLDVWVTPLS